MERLIAAAKAAERAATGHYALPWIVRDLEKVASMKSTSAKRSYVWQFFHDTELVMKDIEVPAHD